MKDYNPFSLAGKRILITGASSGIGLATAVECSRLGAQVILVARNEQRLQQAMSSLEGSGHSYIVTDLSSEESIDQLVESAPNGIDGLVNNAGIGIALKPITFLKSEDVMRVYQTNVLAPMLLTKGLVKKKKMSKGSSIVFISSIGALLATNGQNIYASSKAALTSFMRSCAVEFAPKNIRSNAVLPGMVETKLIYGATLGSEEHEKDKEMYALKRYGKPEEIALAVTYFLSDASAWVTGTSFVIDGGRMLK